MMLLDYKSLCFSVCYSRIQRGFQVSKTQNYSEETGRFSNNLVEVAKIPTNQHSNSGIAGEMPYTINVLVNSLFQGDVMKNMMKIFALGLFVAGSVIFTGCGETTTAPAEETPAAETGAEEAGSDSASAEAAAGDVATVSFDVKGMT